MSDDVIAKIRAELEGLSGTARLGPLTRLGQALAERYWRGGPGSPAGLPDLNAAIAAMDEAYGYIRDGDGLRGQVAGQLGWLLSMRHSVHREDEQDRETGIRRLEEALASPNLPESLRTMFGVQLGALYIGRVTPIFQSPAATMSVLTGQVPPDVAAHADQAADCFRKVLADGPISDEITEAAESMLAIAETLRTMVGGADAGFNLQGLMEAMAGVQKLQDRFARSAKPGHGFRGTASFLSFSDFQSILRLEPLDRPVTVLQQAEPASEPKPSRRPPVAPATIDREQLRDSLHGKLTGTGAADPVWASAAELLLPGAPALAVDIVDEVIALARMIVDVEDGDAGSAAVDWFVLAVALHLRDRLDQDGDRADRLAGAESLVTAVRKVPLDHPAATTMLQALGAFLEEDRPLGGALDAVADDFADRLDAAITAGVAKDAAELATLHALRCLCRAASAMAELGRVAVPPDYPWQATLKAAVRAAG